MCSYSTSRSKKMPLETILANFVALILKISCGSIPWKPPKLAFCQEFFQRGKIYCYDNFSFVFEPNFKGAKVSEGEGNCLRGDTRKPAERLKKLFNAVQKCVRLNFPMNNLCANTRGQHSSSDGLDIFTDRDQRSILGVLNS